MLLLTVILFITTNYLKLVYIIVTGACNICGSHCGLEDGMLDCELQRNQGITYMYITLASHPAESLSSWTFLDLSIK